VNKTPIIVNPAAGEKESTPLELLDDQALEIHQLSGHQPGEAYELAKKLAAKAAPTANTDPGAYQPIIGVYGGDGTVTEVAKALYKTDIALGILPGGTANVMAKELNIPLTLKEAITLLTGEHHLQKIDMGLVNGCPFLIRVNMGLFSDMVTETDPHSKEKWGQLAYGLTAFQTLGREAVKFQLTIDGHEFEQEAVALTITNAGNVGRAGYSFLPDISVTDGWLDVIALDKADISSLLRVSGSILLQKDSAVLKHWKAKEVTIRLAAGTSWLCDDKEEKASDLRITMDPASLKVVVPVNK
jgi:diacylglycerol kinase family enzyme